MEHWAEISTLELMLQIGAAIMYVSASDLIVIASAKAQAGKEKVLEQALLEAAGPTRLQPGCVSFSLYQAVDDPTVMVGFERWASSAAHDQHLNGAHVQTLISKMGPILAGSPQIVSYKVINEE
jgi:quinol monooxygenase YgiN